MTKTSKNTLKSVLVLFVIAAVSVLLLSIANNFIKVEIKVTAKSAALINSIAPTGETDEVAFKDKHIALVKLQNQNYKVKSLDEFNKTFGNSGTKVRALYTSYNTKTTKTTLVVESSGTGYENGEIVILTAYDSANKISGITVQSQNQSYWDKLGDNMDGGIDAFFKTFIGKGGEITSSDIIASTGATIKGTVGGISSAVSLANQFVVALGGEQKLPPTAVTDAGMIQKLKKVSDATTFTKHDEKSPNKITAVYVGDNGDIIYESIAKEGSYGNVKMLVRVDTAQKVAKLSLIDNSFDSNGEHNSAPLLSDATLNSIFVGKSVADIKGMNNNLAGSSGATESNVGIKNAVINALEYVGVFIKP